MLVQLIKFSILWGVNILAATFVSPILFRESPEFDDTFNTLIFFMTSAMGSYSLSAYQDEEITGISRTYTKYIGTSWHLAYVTINSLILMNLVIAIMTDTYASYRPYKKAMYTNQLINTF
jgi:hypothetical protein